MAKVTERQPKGLDRDIGRIEGWTTARSTAGIEIGRIGLIKTMTPDSGRTETVAEAETDGDWRRGMDTMEL